jgi:hypothetical protein
MADMFDFSKEQAKHTPKDNESKKDGNGKPADILTFPPFITEDTPGMFDDAEDNQDRLDEAAMFADEAYDKWTFTQTRRFIFPYIVNALTSGAVLSDSPSIRVKGNLTVAFMIDFSAFLPAFVCGRIVSNNQYNRWGVSVQDIFDNAIYNINKLKLIITPIGYDPATGPRQMTLCSVQLDNDKTVAPWYDTGLLFSDYFLNRMYKKIHGPFFILLLSARKLFIAKTEYTPAQAYEMILASSERPVDHLSDIVYRYDGRNMQVVDIV